MSAELITLLAFSFAALIVLAVTASLTREYFTGRRKRMDAHRVSRAVPFRSNKRKAA